MSHLNELKNGLETARPAPWDDLPDIALYMDQLISYMPRQLGGVDQGEKLTSAMVNNYIKSGLVPRAEGKRYQRSHLAQLTAVCALKRVLSLGEMDTLLKSLDCHGAQERYEAFASQLDTALSAAAQTVEDGENLPALALQLALQSYASQMACRKILEELAPEEIEKKKK